MSEANNVDMATWLAQVRSQFIGGPDDMLQLFDIYAEEALFGRRFIADDLAQLPAGATVLEVGAGAMLLSCQLVREGFRVTALEPIGTGFSHFGALREAVLAHARTTECVPRIVDHAAENFGERSRFDYAFSVNVMEHVGDVACTLGNVVNSLVSGGLYRFTCPNYLFPYEPHFNIPTLFSKRLTERLLHERIFNDTRLPDPAGTWRSLNWINVRQISRITRRLGDIEVRFNRRLLGSIFERLVTDANFARRRSPLVARTLRVLVRVRIHFLFRFIPATLQPIIDCRLRKFTGAKAD